MPWPRWRRGLRPGPCYRNGGPAECDLPGPRLPGSGLSLPLPGLGPGGPRSADELPSYLARLHEAYVEQVNQAVAEGRDDLVRALVDAYPDEALAAMARTRPVP